LQDQKKYLGINLAKEVQNLHSDNYKSLVIELLVASLYSEAFWFPCPLSMEPTVSLAYKRI